MANSLRAKLSKLRHDRKITEEEYQELISKLDGHDRQIYLNGFHKGVLEETKERLVVMKEFENEVRAEILDEFLREIETEWLFRGTDGRCYRDVIKKIAERLKEQNNE